MFCYLSGLQIHDVSEDSLDMSAGLSGFCLITGEGVNLHNQYGGHIDKIYWH